MSRYDLAGSHIPLLVKALQVTTGSVLEVGIGWNSTPLLHWLCKDMGRILFSLEGDAKWTEMFKDYRSSEFPQHLIRTVTDWDNDQLFSVKHGVVLIDHRPALRRRDDALRMKDKAQIILVHDSEPEINRFYGYQKIYKHFKYRYDYTKFKPNTTALSNFIDVERLLK